MKKYDIALCDDEPDYLNQAKKVLTEWAEEQSINIHIHTYTNPNDLLEEIQQKEIVPVIIFMDIEMGDISGINVVEKINNSLKECRIIYLTNYLEYATDVYDTDHFYYVKKGELRKRLPHVLEKYRKEIESENSYFSAALKNSKYVTIKVKDILFFERQGRYTNIYTAGNLYQTKENIDELGKRLSDEQFIRCHNSYIVSLRHIKEYKRDEIIIEERIIPVSRAYQISTREKYMKYLEEQIFE